MKRIERYIYSPFRIVDNNCDVPFSQIKNKKYFSFSILKWQLKTYNNPITSLFFFFPH